jgi:HD-GYP domain-containing protein (c-di-GMP phosphodiesterase class II)
MTSTIAVEELRVGMYIHLEGGWLSHPFPLSAFKISSVDEITTLRGLGLGHVRWVPEKSDLAPAALATPMVARAPVPSAEERAAEQQRAWLAEQREAAQRCERQYGEAAKAWREATEAVSAQPQHAGSTTQALTQAMLDKMLAAEEVGVRLVGGGGDRAAAHALNVTVISMLIGRTLGMGEAEMLDLGVGALMHDVGKQDVPDRLRHAEDGFNAAELNGYRDHVAKGVALGQRMSLSAGAVAVIAQHHENADGTGFPLRLPADRLTLGARIVAIVNRYDNLCNPGSRSLSLTPHEAVAMLFAQSRSRFDPPVLNAFIRMMGVYPAGSLVQLTDDRYAMVVGVNSTRPLKPRVLVHGVPGARGGLRSVATTAPTQLLDLESQPDLGIRRSLAASKLPPTALSALDPRPRVSYYFEALQRSALREELAA